MEEGLAITAACWPRISCTGIKMLAGNRLWARDIDSQATEVAIRVGVLNRTVTIARLQSVRIA